MIKQKTKVVHCKKSDYDVYIGRPSEFGNPFEIGKDGTRYEVIEKYKHYVLSNPELLIKIKKLKGLRLGCWCYPLPCHGDAIIELIHTTKFVDF